ncbi:MAG: Bug family tripartite tricarboxylate transporter substrate binding protein [Lautropia sp.]
MSRRAIALETHLLFSDEVSKNIALFSSSTTAESARRRSLFARSRRPGRIAPGGRQTMHDRLIRRVAAVLCTVVASIAQAQAPYPSKPVTVVCPFAAGGFGDKACRVVAQGLSDRWNSAVVVDNRPGAAGNLAAGYAARRPADGYTLFLSNTATDAINPSIYKKMDFDPLKEFDPVILVVKSGNVLIVNKDLPVRNVKELIELARQQPGKLNFGSPGNGTTGHFTGALFLNLTGVQMATVSYKSSVQVMTDLIGGVVQLTFDNVITWAPQVKADKVRALAVTSSKRSPLLPDVPTLQELGYQNFEGASWVGISVPAGTPPAIVTKLNSDIQAVLSTPDFQAKMEGTELAGGSPAAFKQYIAGEHAKWGKVARDIGLTVE